MIGFCCCARATTGHAAALPSPAMKSRRHILDPSALIGEPIAVRVVWEPAVSIMVATASPEPQGPTGAFFWLGGSPVARGRRLAGKPAARGSVFEPALDQRAAFGFEGSPDVSDEITKGRRDDSGS